MTSRTHPVGNDPNKVGSGTPVDHQGPHKSETAFEHYGDVIDPRTDPDPSNPQGGFWAPEDAHRVADEIASVELGDSDDAQGERPSSGGEEEE